MSAGLSPYRAIAFSCAVDRDPEINTHNHLDLVDQLNVEVDKAGWAGVTIARFERRRGRSLVEIHEGDAPLTLEALRAAAPKPAVPRSEPEQGRLI